MLSLGDENGSTIQIGTKGKAIELYMATAVRSQRVSLGSGVTTGKWHHILVSYDENATDDYELSVYLDGVLSGYTSELGGSLQVKLTDEWLLGVAAKNAQTNGRFTGLLDDMRFYCSTSSEQLAQENIQPWSRRFIVVGGCCFPRKHP